MTTDQQVEMLLRWGRRLDDWVGQDDELAIGRAAERLSYPVRFADLLLARYFKIKDFRTQEPKNFVVNHGQRDYSKNRTSRDIILKAGRTGFTTYVALRGLLFVITRLGATGLLAAHEDKPAQDYFDWTHDAWRWWPDALGSELRMGALKTAKANTRELKFPALGGRYFVETAGDKMAGIGQSIQYLHCTEYSKWKGDTRQVMGNLLSQLTGDQTEACIESRPFGNTGLFFERYQEAKRGEGKFRAHFYAWWWNPGAAIQAVPADFASTDEERLLVRRYAGWRAKEAPPDCGLTSGLTKQQICWRRKIASELPTGLFAQEFAEDDVSCFLGSGNCPFSATGIEKILADVTPVVERTSGTGEPENGLIRWRNPEPAKRYILFLDPASGLAKSRTAMCVLAQDNGEQVAEWVGRIDYLACGALAFQLGTAYNNALLAVETNRGQASTTILKGLEKYPNLYWHHDPGKHKELGWDTNEKTRPDMLDRLGRLVAGSPELFHSRRLAAELRSCERVEDRIQKGKGATDDLVMAAAGAHAVRSKTAIRHEPMVEFVGTREQDTERGWQKI